MRGSADAVLTLSLVASDVVLSTRGALFVGVVSVGDVAESIVVKGTSVDDTRSPEHFPESTSMSSIAMSLFLLLPGIPMMRTL